ncbi:MAG: metallophosphoesterase family protein [Deinococcus sp.]
MRLAVIADIHGNQDALDAVLADAREQGAERLYLNGDVVNRGPDSVSCLQTVLALPPDWLAGCTLGNHDDLMLLWADPASGLPPEWRADPFWGATGWSARRLAEAGLLGSLRDWPMALRRELGSLPTLVLAHGTPEHYREAVGSFLPPGRAVELLDSSGAGVLVASHIHRPMLWPMTDGRWLINTGAVGAPFDGDPRARYLLLDGADGRWTPSIRAVPYSREGVLARFGHSGMLESGGLSALIFREELLSARSIYTPFWDWTEAGSLPRDEARWATFREDRPELFLPA